MQNTAVSTSLFFSRRFLPMFVAQFLGALEDNLFRNAVFVLAAFRIADEQGINSGILISLGAGLFILPFFLFSAMAGTLADHMEKARLVRWLKFIEFPLMFLAGLALVTGMPSFLLLMLFMLGMQAAFFGPVKYGILPQLVHENELVEANAYFEGGTFIAILLGTIIGGALVTLTAGPVAIASLMILLSLCGWIISFLIPNTMAVKTISKSEPFCSDPRPLLREAKNNSVLWRAILGISWFWFVGSVFLSLLPNYVKDILGGTPAIVTFLLTLFVTGIALGAYAFKAISRGRIETRVVPAGILVMAAAIASVSLLGPEYGIGEETLSLPVFITHGKGLLTSVLFIIMSAAGGFFTVPLYTVLQTKSEPTQRSRIIAANNIMNALFMVASSAFTYLMFAAGFKVTAIFFAIALMSIAVIFLTTEHLRYRIISLLLRIKFGLFYRTKVRGIENLEILNSKSAIFICNHVSQLDGLLLAAYLPNCPFIAASAALSRFVCMQLFYLLTGSRPINPSDPSSLKHLVNILKSGRSVAMFPEGRITQTGLLMKIYETPGVIAAKTKSPVIPVHIDGIQYSPLSLLRGKLRTRLFPRVTITVLPPIEIEVAPGTSSRERRSVYGAKLYDIMAEMMFASCNIEKTLYEAFLEARKINGPGTKILEDLDRKPVSYNRLAFISRILGHKFAKFTAKGEKVGVLLPNSISAVGTFLALLSCGRIPAMLNFTSGLANLRSACVAADIENIITSRHFVERMSLETVVTALSHEVRIIYLEDLRKKISSFDKLRAFFEVLIASSLYRKLNVYPDDPAVVLFTSGSEAAPKGVVLSHKNIIANRHQAAIRIDLNSNDTLFNALPIFHSFGLSVGLLLPLLSGVRIFLYPSPLHYRVIPELIYDTNSTILISTDTFLGGYARAAHPYDFYSLRYVVAGGEKLKEETRQAWMVKFGIRILEGYGVTETAPVLSINTTMHFRTGTAGRLVPGIEHRIRKIEGIEKGGALEVRGPNVMLGYLKKDRPGVLQPPKDGWYDTGDIVEIDSDGFVKIIGRIKRFAKIGSEMVSLTAVEEIAQAVAPENAVAVVAIPDSRKGEQLVLYTDSRTLTREKMLDVIQARHLPEIMLPRQIVVMAELPVLGTGKTDYVKLNEMAQKLN